MHHPHRHHKPSTPNRLDWRNIYQAHKISIVRLLRRKHNFAPQIARSAPKSHMRPKQSSHTLLSWKNSLIWHQQTHGQAFFKGILSNPNCSSIACVRDNTNTTKTQISKKEIIRMCNIESICIKEKLNFPHGY